MAHFFLSLSVRCKKYAIVTSGVLAVDWISDLSDKQPMYASETVVTMTHARKEERTQLHLFSSLFRVFGLVSLVRQFTLVS